MSPSLSLGPFLTGCPYKFAFSPSRLQICPMNRDDFPADIAPRGDHRRNFPLDAGSAKARDGSLHPQG